jgi:hypothetical protein
VAKPRWRAAAPELASGWPGLRRPVRVGRPRMRVKEKEKERGDERDVRGSAVLDWTRTLYDRPTMCICV